MAFGASRRESLRSPRRQLASLRGGRGLPGVVHRMSGNDLAGATDADATRRERRTR